MDRIDKIKSSIEETGNVAIVSKLRAIQSGF